jgi:hypothetical protein
VEGRLGRLIRGSQRHTPSLSFQIYQAFCERTYLDQCQVKLLNPSRFGGWLGMLISRPRLRTNGFYMLMSAYIKKPVKVRARSHAWLNRAHVHSRGSFTCL